MQTLRKVEIELAHQIVLNNVLCFFLFFEFFLVLLDVVFNFYAVIPIGSLRRLCNIAREDGIGNWISSFQFLVVTLVVGILSFLNRHLPDYNSQTKLQKHGWSVIAVFFFYLAMDEGAEIHERIGSVFDRLSEMGWGTQNLGDVIGFSSFSWQLVFLPFFGVMGLFILYFLIREVRSRVIVEYASYGVVCWMMAVGLDYFEGTPASYTRLAEIMSFNLESVEHFSRVTEEFLEMFGTTLFLTAFLKQLLLMYSKITFDINNNKIK